MGVQPEKKLMLLLSILFFFFPKGFWFSRDSSSLPSREAAALGIFRSTSWSVMSCRTCGKQGTISAVSHCCSDPPEAARHKVPGQPKELLHFFTQVKKKDEFFDQISRFSRKRQQLEW